MTGVSANADPHTNKLRTRVIHIRDDRKSQPNRSAMERPHPGGTALRITVSSVPGKYAFKPVCYLVICCHKHNKKVFTHNSASLKIYMTR